MSLALEHRGRFVEKDRQRSMGALLQRQGLGEFDHLARSETELARSSGWIDVESNLGEPIARRLDHPPAGDHPEPRERPLMREMEIVRDRHIEEQRLLLKDHRDAVAVGLRGVAQHDRRSIDGNRTRIRPHSAGENSHESGLASAVLADQPYDLMRANAIVALRSALTGPKLLLTFSTFSTGSPT